MIENNDQNLRQIVDMLLLNGTLTECPGLVHGKTGIAVFFFHYARYTDNMLFSDYAIDLIGEMQNQIHAYSSADYEKGIAGIGVGIDYLVQNNFLVPEEDLCEDFDERMVRAVMYEPWLDFSQYDGLTGFGRYWISRLRYPTPSVKAQECLWHIVGLIKERLPDIPEKEQTDVYCLLYNLQQMPGFEMCAKLLKQLQNRDLQSMDVSRSFSRLGDSFVGNVARMYQRNRYFGDAIQDETDNALKQIPDLDMETAPTNTGLLIGYAGEGLLRLAALKQADFSWINLL